MKYKILHNCSSQVPPDFSLFSNRFLHNMNVETRVRALLQGLEVSVDSVLGFRSEGVSDHGTEVLQSVGIVGEPGSSSIFPFPPANDGFT